MEHATCPCSGAPLLAIPCLGGGADGVDVTTTRFLLGMALLRKGEEEEKERQREQEKARERKEKQEKERCPGSWPARGGRERRGGRGGRLGPPLALFVAALVVGSGSGMLAVLVLLVFLFALCSLRRTVAVAFTRLVLLVTVHLALCSLIGRPMMFNITAAMDPKDSCDMVPTFRLQKTAESPQLQSVQVVDISFVPKWQIPMVQAIQQTTEIPLLLFDFRWSMPLSCRFISPSRRRGFSHGPDCPSDHRCSPVAEHGGSCSCCAGRAGLLVPS